jgi:hypothetical protein
MVLSHFRGEFRTAALGWLRRCPTDFMRAHLLAIAVEAVIGDGQASD